MKKIRFFAVYLSSCVVHFLSRKFLIAGAHCRHRRLRLKPTFSVPRPPENVPILKFYKLKNAVISFNT